MNVQKRLKAAIAAHRKGRLQVAANAYNEILTVEPENPDALHFLGMLAHQQGDSEKAIALIRKSLAAHPNNASAQNNLGNLLLTQSRPLEAANAYGAAIMIDPALPESYRNLGVLLRRIGEHAKAAEVLRQAAELSPENPEGWHNLGICHMLLGDLEKAADAFESCVKAGISDQLNAVWHARMLIAMGREDAARGHLERHLAIHPGDPVARHQIAAIDGETADRVPEDYVRAHFNSFAKTFDTTLEALDYRAPALVAEELARWHDGRPAWPLAVDLGCGTGLCGPLIAAHCERLIGIDLSPGMLSRAAETGTYHELYEADLVAFLAEQPDGHVDFAISADTLNYLGDLAPLMSGLARVLRPGGVMVATFEEHAAEAGELGYAIQSHGRYSHTPGYLGAAAEAAGLRIARERRATLRREANADVPGLILTIERPAG